MGLASRVRFRPEDVRRAAGPLRVCATRGARRSLAHNKAAVRRPSSSRSQFLRRVYKPNSAVCLTAAYELCTSYIVNWMALNMRTPTNKFFAGEGEQYEMRREGQKSANKLFAVHLMVPVFMQ